MRCFFFFFFFKQKTAYELRISDWSSDVCSSDLCSSAPAGSTVQGVPRVTAAAFAVQAPAGARFHGVAGRRLEVQPGVVGKPRRQRVQHRGPQVVAERRVDEKDRKSGGWGKRESGRVDLSGRRILKKQKREKND